MEVYCLKRNGVTLPLNGVAKAGLGEYIILVPHLEGLSEGLLQALERNLVDKKSTEGWEGRNGSVKILFAPFARCPSYATAFPLSCLLIIRLFEDEENNFVCIVSTVYSVLVNLWIRAT